MGLPRVTPPKGDSQPAGTTPKAMGSRAPVTPPKAGPPKPGILKVPPGGGEDNKGKEKERIEPGPAKRPVDPKGVKATPKSPPPQGLSPYSSESVSGADLRQWQTQPRGEAIKDTQSLGEEATWIKAEEEVCPRKVRPSTICRSHRRQPGEEGRGKRQSEKRKTARERGREVQRKRQRKRQRQGQVKGKQNKGKDKGQKDQRGEKPGKGSSSRSGGRN